MAVPINPENVLTRIQLLSLLLSTLVVYRVGATYTPDQECNSKSFSVQLHATFAAHLSKRSDPPSAARAQLALRSPHARRLLLHTHTSAPFKSHLYTPRGQPNLICLARLQSRISAPTRGLVEFSQLRWSSVLDCRAWVGSRCRSMDVIQCSRRYERGGTTRHHLSFV